MYIINMDNKNICLFGFLIISIIVIYFNVRKVRESYNNEIFNKVKMGKHNNSWDQLETGRTATDCYTLDKRNCLKYSNCGICMKDGIKQCIPGDNYGPYFTENCNLWEYNNYYNRYIFGDRINRVIPPWNRLYSDYEVKYPSPQSRASLIY